MRSRLPAGVALGLVVALGIFGCNAFSERGAGYRGPGQVQPWPARPWAEAFVYNSAHYSVQTNTRIDVAMYIADLMEKALSCYRMVAGNYQDPLPRFFINAYASIEEYEMVARRLGLPPDITTGLYSPSPPGAIHLPYTKGLHSHPAYTLLHEGLHQFLHQTNSFLVPLDARNTLPPEQHVLMSVPLWLNEGLADYMEGALVSLNQFEFGRINRERLTHLQGLIRRGKCPPIEKVLLRRYGEPFLNDDSAVSWGIVYTLQHAPNPDEQSECRKRLTQYLKACRQAFYNDPANEFMTDFLPRGIPYKDFNRRWADHIARQGREFFGRIIMGKDVRIQTWEREWTERIMALE